MMAENQYFDVIEILDENFESTEAMPKPHNKKGRVQKSAFSLPEKRKLAGVIKGKEAIWKLEWLHRNAHAVSAHWDEVT